ncbi:MAG: hypothetical protein KA052_03420 [Candidatus Pacebacteria bacterium]|nr:hypothetical protein [Candidatus Paceibacterota bacterium]
MTVQETKKFFEGSEFSAETKAKINALLEGKEALDPYTVLEIKAAMQEELSKDFDEAGVDVSQNPNVIALQKEYEEEMKKLEAEMQEDADFVDGELKELDKLQKEVTRVADEMAADKIRESI